MSEIRGPNIAEIAIAGSEQDARIEAERSLGHLAVGGGCIVIGTAGILVGSNATEVVGAGFIIYGFIENIRAAGHWVHRNQYRQQAKAWSQLLEERNSAASEEASSY